MYMHVYTTLNIGTTCAPLIWMSHVIIIQIGTHLSGHMDLHQRQ